MKSFVAACLRFVQPVLDPMRTLNSVPRYAAYWQDYLRFRKKIGKDDRQKLTFLPAIHEKGAAHEVDFHYLFQSYWATRKVLDSRASAHVDVASDLNFSVKLAAHVDVTFVDLRNLSFVLPRFRSICGSILDLPFDDNSVPSLSCLHVIEHIGLGRYGDEIDPAGTKKACSELSRVVAAGGSLFLSTPIGKDRIMFNAHRVLSPTKVTDYFCDLELFDFAVITEDGRLLENVQPADFIDATYSCGLFHFIKRK